MKVGEEYIGYYPAELFSNMASADRVGWGGRTVTPPGLPSPQMGSGIFPDKNFYHAAYFRFISFQNEERKDFEPNKHMTKAFIDKSDCFNVEHYGDGGEGLGSCLQYGGPGGVCGDWW